MIPCLDTIVQDHIQFLRQKRSLKGKDLRNFGIDAVAGIPKGLAECNLGDTGVTCEDEHQVLKQVNQTP